jgi:DNA-binding CsgD family transcriptional regulator
MEDLQNVISQERTKLYEKNALKQACEGKSAEEIARIMAEFLSKRK